MNLTAEQIAIIKSTGDIKINAIAGSGKTTTIIEYAASRPPQSKILYLAFNKSVKLEAKKKFNDKGLFNVTVETAHSLAYKSVIFGSSYKVSPQGYKIHEIVEILGLQDNGEKHSRYVIANHIDKFTSYFCNSDKEKVQDLNYLDIVTDGKAKAFVKMAYPYLEKMTRLFLGKMDSGEIDITHDFYLKKFQLTNPVLRYDYILFDEGQDASPAMLDVFLKQKAVKVIVGDTHQQIYGWRFAVNSLEKARFKTYHLSTSFRFSEDIAKLADGVLKFKSHLGNFTSVTIKGKGQSTAIKTKAVLARTNLGLLLKAIEYVREKEKLKYIYFEGNINSYTYADEGASLYDVLNLYNGKRKLIRDELIKSMKDLNELIEYIDNTEDVQLRMMVEIVKEYGNEIPGLLKVIKDKHVPNEEKEKAEMIFSTVHRCKGMEYDSVQLVNDFLTEEKLEKIIKEQKEEEVNRDKLNEEINLLYVAVTRTRNSIYIPETLMPKDLTKSTQVHVIKVAAEEKEPVKEAEMTYPYQPSKHTVAAHAQKKEKTYSVEKVREIHKEAYMPWTPELDEELTVMFCEGVNIKDLAVHFGRTKGAIRSRIKKLELVELYH